jgi:hypothetical protein
MQMLKISNELQSEHVAYLSPLVNGFAADDDTLMNAIRDSLLTEKGRLLSAVVSCICSQRRDDRQVDRLLFFQRTCWSELRLYLLDALVHDELDIDVPV